MILIETFSITPRPKKVDTWQLQRAFEWVLVFQNPFKDLQSIWHPNPFGKRYTTPPNKLTKFRKYFNTYEFCKKFDRTPLKTKTTPCPRKTVYIVFNTFSLQGSHQSTHLILISSHNLSTKQLRQRQIKNTIYSKYYISQYDST